MTKATENTTKATTTPVRWRDQLEQLDRTWLTTDSVVLTDWLSELAETAGNWNTCSVGEKMGTLQIDKSHWYSLMLKGGENVDQYHKIVELHDLGLDFSDLINLISDQIYFDGRACNPVDIKKVNCLIESAIRVLEKLDNLDDQALIKEFEQYNRGETQ